MYVVSSTLEIVVSLDRFSRTLFLFGFYVAVKVNRTLIEL